MKTELPWQSCNFARLNGPTHIYCHHQVRSTNCALQRLFYSEVSAFCFSLTFHLLSLSLNVCFGFHFVVFLKKSIEHFLKALASEVVKISLFFFFFRSWPCKICSFGLCSWVSACVVKVVRCSGLASWLVARSRGSLLWKILEELWELPSKHIASRVMGNFWVKNMRID